MFKNYLKGLKGFLLFTLLILYVPISCTITLTLAWLIVLICLPVIGFRKVQEFLDKVLEYLTGYWSGIFR